jgi:DNA-binding transcriptional LysR family regulator
MHKINLAQLDLNLLMALHALLEERSVTRAGETLGLSQSATSHALNRLRKLFDDPLLVRTSKGMVPTPRAENLLEPLRKILSDIKQLIQTPTFDPKTAIKRQSTWRVTEQKRQPLVGLAISRMGIGSGS